MTVAWMKPILYLTHLTAVGIGSLLWHWLTSIFKPKKLESEMANKFESILGDVGKGLLWLFTNKTAAAIETGGLDLAGSIWPGLNPLFAKIAASIAKAQAQASVSTAGMSTEQIIAMVLEDAQVDFQAAGITESARQQAIVSSAIAFIDSIPSGSVNAAVVQSAVSAAASAAPAAPRSTVPAVTSAAKPAEVSAIAAP